MFVVTFYSYKGGVGRTSALMNTASRLAIKGKKVLIIDFDLEAPGIDSFQECSANESRLGVVDYIVGFLTSGKISSIRDFVYETSIVPGKPGILVLPAGRKDHKYQADLSRLDWKVLYKQRKGFLFIENLKASLKQEFAPDYVLIDSRTGLTDISGICTLQLPNLVVLLFSLNNQNLYGIGQIFKSIRFNKVNKSIQTLLVASPIPEIPDSVGIRKARLESALRIVGAPTDLVLPYDPFISFEETIVTEQDSKTTLSKSYDALTDAIISANQGDVLTMLKEAKRLRDKGNAELAELRFQEIIESKPECFEGWLEYGIFMRMRGRLSDSATYLERAAKLAPKNSEVLAQLASNYLSMKQWSAATEAFDRLLAIGNGNDSDQIVSVVQLFRHAGLLEQAHAGFLHLIRNGGGINNYTGLGEILMRKKQYREAFDVYNQGIKLQPASLACAYNAGRALECLGDVEGSSEWYRRAVEMFEHLDTSPYTLQWLANGHVAISFAYAALGKNDKALQMISSGIDIAKRVDKVLIFSPLSYTNVSRDEFIRDAERIANEIKGRLPSLLNPGVVTQSE